MSKVSVVRPEPVIEKFIVELAPDEADLLYALLGSVASTGGLWDVYMGFRNILGPEKYRVTTFQGNHPGTLHLRER